MKIFNFGRLRTLRKQNHMTQSQVGALLGCSGTTVSNWERGLTCISVNDLLKLSEIYHDDNFSDFFVESICDEHVLTNEEKAICEQLNAAVEEAGHKMEAALDFVLSEEIPDEDRTAQDRFDREFLLDLCAESFDVAEKYYLDFKEELRKRVSQRLQNSNGSSNQQ